MRTQRQGKQGKAVVLGRQEGARKVREGKTVSGTVNMCTTLIYRGKCSAKIRTSKFADIRAKIATNIFNVIIILLTRVFVRKHF